MTTRLACLTALLAAGCSVIAVRHPDQLPAGGAPVACESELPALDGIVAAAGAGMALAGGASGAAESSSEAAALVAAGAVVALLYGASALYGTSAVGDCRKLVRDAAAPTAALDPDLHDTVFLRNAAIVRRLTATAPPPP
jgi:hypothetical protein